MFDTNLSIPRYKKLLKKLAIEKMENSNMMSGMYSLVTFGGFHDTTMLVLKTGFLNLKDAANARIGSGDIIVFSESGRVVPNSNWLWDWERLDSKSYAHKKILKAIEGR